MNKIVIKSDIFKDFVTLAKLPPHHEICGILTGRILNECAFVDKINMIPNIAAEEAADSLFIMDGHAAYGVLKTTKFMDSKNEVDFCGVIHTHPEYLPIPSMVDYTYACEGGYHSGYLIYSPDHGLLNAYFWNSDIQLFEPIEVKVT